MAKKYYISVDTTYVCREAAPDAKKVPLHAELPLCTYWRYLCMWSCLSAPWEAKSACRAGSLDGIVRKSALLSFHTEGYTPILHIGLMHYREQPIMSVEHRPRSLPQLEHKRRAYCCSVCLSCCWKAPHLYRSHGKGGKLDSWWVKTFPDNMDVSAQASGCMTHDKFHHRRNLALGRFLVLDNNHYVLIGSRNWLKAFISV